MTISNVHPEEGECTCPRCDGVNSGHCKRCHGRSVVSLASLSAKFARPQMQEVAA